MTVNVNCKIANMDSSELLTSVEIESLGQHTVNILWRCQHATFYIAAACRMQQRDRLMPSRGLDPPGLIQVFC